MPPSGCVVARVKIRGGTEEERKYRALRDENFGQLSVGGSVETIRLVAIIAIIAAICLQNEERDFSRVYPIFRFRIIHMCFCCLSNLVINVISGLISYIYIV